MEELRRRIIRIMVYKHIMDSQVAVETNLALDTVRGFLQMRKKPQWMTREILKEWCDKQESAIKYEDVLKVVQETLTKEMSKD